MKYLKIIFAAIIVCGVASCKKSFLNLAPYNALPLTVSTSNEGNLFTAVNGMYNTLRSVVTTTSATQSPWDVYGRTVPVKGDLMGDNTYVRPANSGRYLDFNDYNITTGNANAQVVWVGAYRTIKEANNIINSALAANTNVNQMRGEAYAIRALCYFELLRNYSRPYNGNPNALGVPLITTFNQELLPTRNTIGEVYKQILDDLNQAYNLMTVNLGSTMAISGTTTVRTINTSIFTKYAARGLQAKVYLYMADYANAKTAALDVVTNSGVNMVSNAGYVTYWKNPAPRTDKVETLFELSNDIGNNNGTNALAYMYEQSGYGDILATNDLVSKYRTGDVRLGVIIPLITSGVTTYVVNKYSNTSNTADKDDIKILRISDVILILAEAYARTADEVNARKYLNQVAQNREPSFTGYTSTGQQLIDDIILERRKELAFEGDRFFDLNRLNLPITKVRRENPTISILIAPDDFRRIFPIPQAELDVNPNIRSQQNPGY